MTIEPFSSPQKMNEYIHQEMTALLHANDISTLDSYGWIDADTHDPDLVGHTMRQTDSLSLRLLFGEHPPPLPPWQKFLVIAGADFEGLIAAARISIGLMLFQSDIVGERASTFNTRTPIPPLSVHLMSAMIFLSTASDRLRDVFVAAVYNNKTKKYDHSGEYNGKNRRLYTTPFIEAVERLQNRPFADSVAKLPLLTERILTFRRMRNKIIHIIATELAEREKNLVDDPPSARNDEESELDWEPTEAMIRESLEGAESQHRERMSHPIHWYQLLIKASNHVFIIENMLRNRAKYPYHL